MSLDDEHPFRDDKDSGRSLLEFEQPWPLCEQQPGCPNPETLERIATVVARRTADATARARDHWRHHFRKKWPGYFAIHLGNPVGYASFDYSSVSALAEAAHFDPEKRQFVRALAPIGPSHRNYEEVKSRRTVYEREIFHALENSWAARKASVYRDEPPLRARRAGR